MKGHAILLFHCIEKKFPTFVNTMTKLWYRSIGFGKGQFAEKGLKWTGHEADRLVGAAVNVSSAPALIAGQMKYIAIAAAAAVIGLMYVKR
jgi:hypothetical protein